MLRMGYSQADITPDRPMELVGFYREDNRSSGVLKPLLAQVTVWEAEGKCCLIAVDSIGFTKELSDALRNRVGEALALNAEQVMVCFSHTHAAPDADREKEYCREVSDRITAAALRAKFNMTEVLTGRANAKAQIGVNRRPVSDETDDRVGILKVCDKDGNAPKLLILRVTAHGNVLKRDNRMISPDWFGDLRETAGERFGCPVMVIQGSAGSTAPKYFCSKETPVDATGERYIRSETALRDMAKEVTEAVAEVMDGIRLRDNCEIGMFSRHIELTADVPTPEEAELLIKEALEKCGITDSGWGEKVRSLNKAGIHVQTENVEIQYFRIGDWCMCGGPYEFMAGFALRAEKLSGNEFFYVNGYTNGCLLYFPTEEEFDYGGYEVFWSMLIYYVYIDRVYPFRRESASQMINFMVSEYEKAFIPQV